MSLFTLCRVAAISGALLKLAAAQTSGSAMPFPQVAVADLQQPAVPADPLELVGSNAQPVQDPSQRAAILNLLANAKALSNVRAGPYDLKTTFTSFGSSSSDGNWQLENVAPGHGVYRWTAQGPGYSVVNLNKEKLIYSNQPNVGITLRLSQVRSAIFYVNTVFGARASIRTASANLNGVELTCALTQRMSPPKSAAGGRLWDEEEFCIDPKTGLLVTYSPVPGLYIQYDYSNAVHFHNRIIPSKFTIAEGGRTVVEAHTQSVSDPTNLDPSLFDPSGLSAVGVGPMETPPSNFRNMEFPPQGSSTVSLQFVVLHAMASPDGHLSDPEILASSDSSQNQHALERLAKWQNRPMMKDLQQPGAAPQSHEIFFTFQFLVPAGS